MRIVIRHIKHFLFIQYKQYFDIVLNNNRIKYLKRVVDFCEYCMH